MDAWKPEQYERFKAERKKPFDDLLARIERRPAMRVLDLGCGTGELTAELHRTLAAKETLGVDSSPAMLERARGQSGPGLSFLAGDIASVESDTLFDLVFSNAALQWVAPARGTLTRVASLVAPGGQLAIQVPANFDHPSHTVAVALAQDPEFAPALGGFTAPPAAILVPEGYAAALDEEGFSRQRVSLEVYAHHLASRDEVVEWVRGTLLTDYQRRMPEPLFERFLDRYRAALAQALPDRRPFLYPFKRILVWASF